MSDTPNKVFIKLPEIDWDDDAAVDAVSRELWEVITARLGSPVNTDAEIPGGKHE